MPELESLDRAYFKGLRLGDFVHRRPTLRVVHTKPDFQPSTGAAKANARAAGVNGYYVVSFQIAFKRGYLGVTESRSQFWDRVVQFGVDLLAALAATGTSTGVSREGPLCFVRDPEGVRFGRDRTVLDGIEVAGSPVQMTTDYDVAAAGWLAGQYVLFVDPGNPTGFSWETAQIELVSNFDIQVDELTYDKQDDAEIFRVERIWPEMDLFEDVQIGAGGPAEADFVHRVDLSFAGTVDPIAGNLP